MNLVLVDIRVMEGDAQVPDLRPDEVTLLVDGSVRPFVSFVYYAGADTTAAPTRRLVLVVDRESIEAGEARELQKSAEEFVRGLAPGYAVSVTTLPLGASITFEQDPRKTLAALHKAFAGTTRRGAGLEGIAGFGCTGAAASSGCGDQNLPPRAKPMNLSAEWQLRGRSVMRDLEWLFRAVSDGPSDIVLVTGGLPRDERLRSDIDRLLATARLARVHLHAVEIADLTRVVLPEGGRVELPTMDAVRAQQAPAYDLPAETGGLEERGSVSGKTFFRRLTRELSGSYLLAFEPLPSDGDGKPHRIEVRVSRRPAAAVHARKMFILPATQRALESRTSAVQPTASPATPPATSSGPSAAVAGATDVPPVAAANAVQLQMLLQRASAYVDLFERSLSSLVAEERYVQVVKLWGGVAPNPVDDPELVWKEGKAAPLSATGRPLRRRQLLSDVLLVQSPGQMWIGYRDVAEVDGKPVRDRAIRTKKLFLSGTVAARRQLQRIADESARHNLGAARNINMPTFPLQMLRPSNLSRFAWTLTASVPPPRDTASCAIVSFREVADPTIVKTNTGRNVPMTGQFCIEPDTGRVWRARLTFEEPRELVEGAFEVTFRSTSDPAVLIPDRAWEWAISEDPESRGRLSVVEGQAFYENIRRFSVTTEERLK